MKISEMFPSRFMKAEDFEEGESRILTIKMVEMEELGQGKDAKSKPVIYFRDHEKQLVLNKTNCSIVAKLHGDDTDDWVGKRIALYAVEVESFGDVVRAIRVKTTMPKPAIPEGAVPTGPGLNTHNLSSGNGNGDAPKQATAPASGVSLFALWPDPLKRVYAPNFTFKDAESRARTQGAVVGALDEMAGDTVRRHAFLMALSGKDSIKDQSDALIKALAGWVNHPQAKSEVNRIIAEHLKAQGQAELPMKEAA